MYLMGLSKQKLIPLEKDVFAALAQRKLGGPRPGNGTPQNVPGMPKLEEGDDPNQPSSHGSELGTNYSKAAVITGCNDLVFSATAVTHVQLRSANLSLMNLRSILGLIRGGGVYDPNKA